MKPPRLHALDGLKGLAIIAVIFTHLPLSVWYQALPPFLHPLLTILLSSGGTAVTLFFVSTGYLMGRLYPYPVSPVSFWRRRYARLFPPFLVMVASFTIFRLMPALPPVSQILVVLGCAIVMRLLILLYHRLQTRVSLIGTLLFSIFFLLQIGTGIWYMFYLLNVPPAVYYQLWSPLRQTLATTLINATLTLPLGQYIPQLDGIYWALAAEVLFYLLYPLLFAPLAQRLHFPSRLRIYLSIISLMLFSFALYLIGQRLLGLETLKLHLMLYFIVGVLLGSHQSVWEKKIQQRSFLRSPIWCLILLGSIFCSIFLNSLLQKSLQPWVTILAIIPTSLLIMTITIPASFTHRFFSFSALRFFGWYSYALFLVHSFVIHIGEYFIRPDTPRAGLELMVFVFSGSIILAWVLYELTEKPYFHSRKKLSSPDLKKTAKISPLFARISLTAMTILLLYFSTRPPLALFTISTRHGGKSVWSVFPEQSIPIRDHPLRYTITSPYDNLGMIMAHIRNRAIPNKEGGFVASKLFIRLYDDNKQLLTENSYNAYEIIDSRYHPFGFPVQASAKAKTYTVEYELSATSAIRETEMVISEQDILSVHFVDKALLVKQPSLLGLWAVQKIGEPFYNPMYWFLLSLLTPFLVSIWVATKPRRHPS